MKGNFDIVIPQISVFTLIQHTLSSLHSLVISLIYDHPLNTLWQVCSATTICLMEPVCAERLKKILKVVYPMLSYIVILYYT